ncbi:MAG: outer membrane protein assembly factor BamC, partial [Pseudomonadales bacterium]|nr:outer membrane protein assembly factor BamC [Pseudomonadales bacterium]
MNLRSSMILAIGLSTNLISGCSFLFGNEGYFRSRSLDYQAAQEHKPLVLPADVEVVARPEIYPIPDINPTVSYYRPADLDEVPRPESLLSVDVDAGLEMRTDGESNWLVADRSFEDLWDDLLLFYKASGVQLESADVASQTIVTSWLKPKKKAPEGFWDSFVDFFSFDNTENQREKFRLQVLAGERVTQQNIFVQHVRIDISDESLPETANIAWSTDGDEDSLVTAMYDEIISYLSDDEVRFRRSSLFSQNLTSSAPYVLTRDGNGFPVLVIQQDFNRAWIAVGDALANTNLVIDDRNRSLGIFYLMYGKDQDGEDLQYELKLNRAENGVQVAVQINDEQIAPRDVSDLIL